MWHWCSLIIFILWFTVQIKGALSSGSQAFTLHAALLASIKRSEKDCSKNKPKAKDFSLWIDWLNACVCVNAWCDVHARVRTHWNTGNSELSISYFSGLVLFIFLLKYNWHAISCSFQVHIIVIWNFYTLENDPHNKTSYHLSPSKLLQYCFRWHMKGEWTSHTLALLCLPWLGS